jgi:CBS domain-containing protein
MKLRALVGGRAELCGPETTLREAADAMVAANEGSLGIVDGRRLAGIVTERDLLRALAEGADPGTATVAQWMTTEPDVVTPDADVEEACSWMLEQGYRHLPVMEEGELLGIISIRDLLWAVTAPT